MTQKVIGPSFYDELLAANVATLPFVWSPDGSIHYGDTLTDTQRAAIEAVYEAHDPTKPSYEALRESARAALKESDITVMRCYEAGLTLPADWTAFRESLRTIVSATAGTASSLPEVPAYPAGS